LRLRSEELKPIYIAVNAAAARAAFDELAEQSRQTWRRTMATTIPDSHRDLLDQPVATLATIAPDGRPQLSAVWFIADQGELKISLNTGRQKVRNLQQRPACTLFLLDLANPYRYVEVRGDADLAPDDDYAFADRVGAKYGTDLRAMDKPGERRVIVTIKPTRVNAVDMSG
jgi:PPOX class probable F420-dependent enzyme